MTSTATDTTATVQPYVTNWWNLRIPFTGTTMSLIIFSAPSGQFFKVARGGDDEDFQVWVGRFNLTIWFKVPKDH